MKFPLTVMYDINNCGKIGLVHIVYQTERPTEQVTYIHDIEIDAIAFYDKCYINWSRHNYCFQVIHVLHYPRANSHQYAVNR